LNWLEKLCIVHGLYDEKILPPTPMIPGIKPVGHIISELFEPPYGFHHIPLSNTQEAKRGIFDNRQFLAY